MYEAEESGFAMKATKMIWRLLLAFFLLVPNVLIDGMLVTYKGIQELLIARSQAGDHWQETTRAKCFRFRKAVYSAEDETCRCPSPFPHFYSNGDETGCFASDEIDPSKFLFCSNTENVKLT